MRDLLRTSIDCRRPDYRIDLADLPEVPRSDGYCMPAGYRHREHPAYHVDVPYLNAFGVRIHGQPDVYTEARRAAQLVGATRIIDVGCGDGAKLAKLSPEYRVVGVDYGPNIERARLVYPFGEWLEHDLSVAAELPVDTRDAVVVCADVIEHLVDPDRLLDILLAASAGAYTMMLSTPDRERHRGEGDLGPPLNPAHTREWTALEFARYLRSRGFTRGQVGYTRYRTWRLKRRNIIARLDGRPSH